jgi:hypothetical protein
MLRATGNVVLSHLLDRREFPGADFDQKPARNVEAVEGEFGGTGRASDEAHGGRLGQ